MKLDRIPIGSEFYWMRYLFLITLPLIKDAATTRPIIGILAMEYYPNKTEGGSDGLYIAASYVKMVESSGARVVPILTGRSRSYYQKMVNSVNGMLFPGGRIDLWAEDGYGRAATIIYDLVLDANKRGVHFPLYGVCLGMEVLAVASVGNGFSSKDVLVPVKGAGNAALALNLVPDFNESKLFYNTPGEVIVSLQKNITANHHRMSITEESLKKCHLSDTWRITAWSQTFQNDPFVSTMEHTKFPHIFGTQFHPEKIPFEWNPKNVEPHDLEAIRANRWFYDYFVEHSRRNDNKFASEDEEDASLIYRCPTVFTPGGDFHQIYRFSTATEEVQQEK